VGRKRFEFVEANTMTWRVKTYYVSAAVSSLIALISVLVLEWSHVIYMLSMILNMLNLDVSLTHLALAMPESFAYDLFALKYIVISMFVVALVISLWAGIAVVKHWVLLLYGLGNLAAFAFAFIVTSYVMFPAQHYTAKYLSVEEFIGSNFREDQLGTAASAAWRVMVLEINGDARAYPINYITQTHVAGGELVGGEDVVMTFCGLSHLAVPFANEVNGQKLNLRVMGQFHNNLVLFDRDTNEPIHQIRGKFEHEGTALKAYPSVMMSIDNFVALYPDGMVYYRPPNERDFIDKMVFTLLEHAMGEQYDPSTSELAFDTTPYADKRLPAKELIYAITDNGKSVVFTKEFVANQSGGYLEYELENQTIAVKYFAEYDYIDMFVGGGAQNISHLGELPDGTMRVKYRHINQMLWRVYQYFYPDSELFS
jgi:hypothetical protein